MNSNRPAHTDHPARALRDRIIESLNSLADLESASGGPTSGDFELNPRLLHAPRLIPAAVLVPIVERTSGLTVLLTQRTDHLTDHAGQISFPGGRVEERDHGPVETAIRETDEEIGLKHQYIKIAGCLDLYQTATGFLITPVVGFVSPGFSLTLDSFEVADAFEVPLAFILNSANHRIERRTVSGIQRAFHVFEYGHRVIWGATAGMLMNLFRRIPDEGVR